MTKKDIIKWLEGIPDTASLYITETYQGCGGTYREDIPLNMKKLVAIDKRGSRKVEYR